MTAPADSARKHWSPGAKQLQREPPVDAPCIPSEQLRRERNGDWSSSKGGRDSEQVAKEFKENLERVREPWKVQKDLIMRSMEGTKDPAQVVREIAETAADVQRLLELLPSRGFRNTDTSSGEAKSPKSPWNHDATQSGDAFLLVCAGSEAKSPEQIVFEDDLRTTYHPYAVGTAIEVWTNSHQKWCDGFVKKVVGNKVTTEFMLLDKPAKKVLHPNSTEMRIKSDVWFV